MASNINVSELLGKMLTAAAGPLQQQGPKAKDYAESEFKKFLIQVQHIEDLKGKGQISEEEAKFLLDMQRHSMRSVLLTLEGLGILAVEAAINAALAVVRDAINTAIGGGWKIL